MLLHQQMILLKLSHFQDTSVCNCSVISGVYKKKSLYEYRARSFPKKKKNTNKTLIFLGWLRFFVQICGFIAITHFTHQIINNQPSLLTIIQDVLYVCRSFVQHSQLIYPLKRGLVSTIAVYGFCRKRVWKQFCFWYKLNQQFRFPWTFGGPTSIAVNGAFSRMSHMAPVVGEAFMVKMTRNIKSS